MGLDVSAGRAKKQTNKRMKPLRQHAKQSPSKEEEDKNNLNTNLCKSECD